VSPRDGVIAGLCSCQKIELQFVGRPVRSLVTILTELSHQPAVFSENLEAVSKNMEKRHH
jgi:hypothetical protein